MKNRTKQLGRFVKARRVEHGFSLRQAATAAKITTNMLFRVERGSAKLTIEDGTRLALVLGWTDLPHMLTAFQLKVEQDRRPRVPKVAVQSSERSNV